MIEVEQPEKEAYSNKYPTFKKHGASYLSKGAFYKIADLRNIQ